MFWEFGLHSSSHCPYRTQHQVLLVAFSRSFLHMFRQNVKCYWLLSRVLFYLCLWQDDIGDIAFNALARGTLSPKLVHQCGHC